MSTQFIIDNATSLDIDLVTLTSSIGYPTGALRGGIPTRNKGRLSSGAGDFAVYKFTVGAPRGLKYSENRELMEDLYFNQQSTTANISLSNNAGMDYLTADPGGLLGDAFTNASNQYNNGDVMVLSASESGIFDPTNTIGAGNTLRIEYAYMPFITIQCNTGTVSSNVTSAVGQVALKAGTWLQMDSSTGGSTPKGFDRPFRLIGDAVFSDVNSDHPLESAVLPGKITNSSVLGNENALFVDRLPAPRGSISGNGVYLKRDGDVRFKVKPVQIPNYTITPGDNIEFDGDFVYMEEIT